MQLGMIGLGRMGANIVRRLMRAGHACVVHDVNAANVHLLANEGATGSASLAAFVASLATPRVVWIMVPAAAVEETLGTLVPLLARGDIVIDGGNSHYVEDIRRARELAAHGIAYLDVGTSGGVWGLEQGYCLMVGGEEASVRHVAPIFEALAPGEQAAVPTASRGRAGTAQRGWLHCGTAGAGHFVKMVHNGIEYGVMAAFAEGFNLMRHANAGAGARGRNAETAPLAHPGHFLFDLDVAEVAEVWRRGSVVRSWLLDLIAEALAKDPHLDGFEGLVSDSGEGRWTVNAAVEASVPVPVLSAALFARFSSRGEDDFANRLLSAMRREFGGHAEVRPPPDTH
ncbi:MAG TPA: decarboxylating 6-phosphogluconate dehydrogenase [Usitatibacter sp.]|jgi:6-phosphogluconate dehydrogenase|nr:decarboxylating 6-phosphogluconate dehydrogenase [Usitatibacter sp.]